MCVCVGMGGGFSNMDCMGGMGGFGGRDMGPMGRMGGKTSLRRTVHLLELHDFGKN